MKRSLISPLVSFVTIGCMGVPTAGLAADNGAPPMAAASAGAGDPTRASIGFTMAQVGPGAAVLTSVLVIPEGPGARTMLVRAAGPALAAFGVAGPLTHPAIAIFSGSGSEVASNEGWTKNEATVATASTAVGTFPFPADSKDAALVAALLPGRYIVQVSSLAGDTGIALLEVYDLTASTSLGNLAAVNRENAPALTPNTANRSLSTQLVLHLPLTTDVEDASSRHVPIRAAGVVMRDGAAWFDGKQSEIVLPHVALDHRAFAVAMWIKLEDDFPGIGLVQQRAAHRRNQHLHLVLRNAAPRLGFYINDLPTSTTVTPRDGWTHLVFQYTGQRQEIWINGRSAGAREARPYRGASGDFIVGRAPRWSNVPAHDFKGGMRDLRVYARALTSVEIGALAKQ